MLIMPAIDLRGGTCVRLAQGRFDAVTEYGDPLEQTRAFHRAGAKWIHVVDLDGAQAGAPAQHALIGQLARETTAHIQSGGGVRTREHVQALLDTGVSRAVIGSAALQQPDAVRDWIEDFGVERVCCAFDVRFTGAQWEVALHGWKDSTGATLPEALALYPPGALRHILVTDISRDGVLAGPNVELMAKIVAARPDLSVQGSGGVAALSDLAALRASGAAACIVGRALYERRFSLEDALAG